MELDTFEEIEERLRAVTDTVVWASVATFDRQGRPRSRILHPLWDGSTGWIGTNRHSHKAKHLAVNPWVSVSYWDQRHELAMVECKAEWDDTREAKQALWGLMTGTPEPVGYAPTMFWQSVDDPAFGALKLTPWRIAVWSTQAMATGEPPLVWRQTVE